MDDDDQSAAEAFQMELEQRQREEEIERGWLILAASRAAERQWLNEMSELNERIETNWRDFHGNHGF